MTPPSRVRDAAPGTAAGTRRSISWTNALGVSAMLQADGVGVVDVATGPPRSVRRISLRPDLVVVFFIHARLFGRWVASRPWRERPQPTASRYRSSPSAPNYCRASRRDHVRGNQDGRRDDGEYSYARDGRADHLLGGFLSNDRERAHAIDVHDSLSNGDLVDDATARGCAGSICLHMTLARGRVKVEVPRGLRVQVGNTWCLGPAWEARRPLRVWKRFPREIAFADVHRATRGLAYGRDSAGQVTVDVGSVGVFVALVTVPSSYSAAAAAAASPRLTWSISTP
jgi:hypothetical protein